MEKSNQIGSDKPWYHGSPQKLTRLKAGSTITQQFEIARIFSHKPAVVVGNGAKWKHTGPFIKGFVYRLLGLVCKNDIVAVPNSTMSKGDEWNTRREFRLELVAETIVNPAELLTKHELKEMVKRGEVDKTVIETIFKKQQYNNP
ncbi:MAG: hypothetical protein A2509_01315 [Candidatus Edwardsbacteria bacterium RIFOXYD12_FULL_50_11]|uniref:Uncharacterized protein n=1 Tax=Candidatus Edwardsbacteria bacterium GWF2_54_11 TaxID=1817851 RepID=A0A1F5RDK1_9BACT|nr:MAG: hypothetical protein A2502_02645 [Candidatus Edwardsbacteria bacterium RifOxyC12_full_54_24]OGF07619.1 MAG: hypothetical protein A2273_03895 [Candidatus Edwardsbacteria bacterium RifOxyA12_full_54_48]OGF09870.1 MAG: hypothetical protein A3K15_10305 [Candidatus Edwardsbacteria bacterium GWE2_54_12]OGF12131.1 MAG: hypothetical protein A2024_03860 [Candidatus Edwardsbacteria bacterium GWF2_54_11]OGF16231.1 MAG: hypothetical protein A2509_01315 [Candidatus Edwardsbacteria bacterium RIFOXYD1